MKLNRPLIPDFLKKAEHRMLVDRPVTWSTRTHLVIYYGLLLIIPLVAISYLIPDDPRTSSNVHYWLLFITIVSILFLTVWLIFLLRFNVFKRFGIVSKGSTLATFLFLFISTGIIVLFNYVQPYIESVRANNKYANEELISDINRMNVLINQLEYDSIPHIWTEQNILIVDDARAEDYNYRTMEESVAVTVADTIVTDTVTLKPRKPRIMMDSATFNARFSHRDSLVKVNDSMYVNFECPDLIFVHSYSYTYRSEDKLLESTHLYRQFLQNYKMPADKRPMQRELQSVIQKYTNGLDPLNYYQSNDKESYASTIRSKYDLALVSRSIYNITSRKFRFSDGDLPVLIRLFLYSTLAISLLIFVFRHSTVKTFFLTLLTGILLCIFTALVMAFLRYSETTFMIWLLFLYLSFFILSAMSWKTKSRLNRTGIPLNLFVMMTPYVPLIIVTLYYTILRKKLIFQEGVSYSTIFVNENKHLLYAEYAGAVLLLVLIPTYIYAAYRKWYSLPEN